MTDPGAELKAFEDRARYFVLTNHGWEDPVEISLDGAVEIVTAFAAKEVARSDKVAMAVAVLLRAKCSEAEWNAFPDEITSVADDALARAVEEEREACAVIAENHYLYDRDNLQIASAIRERSQVKGER